MLHFRWYVERTKPEEIFNREVPTFLRNVNYHEFVMFIEAVREDVVPSRNGLVRDFMRIECRHCATGYYLHHEHVKLKVLRDWLLMAAKKIANEHPNHTPRIELQCVEFDQSHRRFA